MGDLPMIGVGTYRELQDLSPSAAQSIHEAIDPEMPPAERRRLAFYLALGTPAIRVMGMRRDVIDGEDIFLGESLLTDGEWFWRQDLAHYVVKYGLALPVKLIEHAASNLWRPPVLSDSELVEAAARIRQIMRKSMNDSS
jgi:hypothetical protein